MKPRPATVGRVAIGVTVAVGLVIGGLTGLSRMGWEIGGLPAISIHGPLFALGFLGTVIGMERAVALRRGWVWVVPGVSAAAIVGLIAGAPSAVPAMLLVVGGFGLVAIFITAHRMQPELHIRVMGAGAACWAIGAVGLLAGLEIARLVPAMAGFLVLTIFGERLELTRLIGVRPGARRWLLATSILIIGGAAVALWDIVPGAALSGVGFLGAAIWLARNDVAKRTVKVPGVTRYMAASLLVGYVWLAVAGVIWIGWGLVPGEPSYDAAVHTVFLGFVFSMVFAHAPVIVPALTGRAVPFNASFWIPVGLLHASLVQRVLGDLAGSTWNRQWGGMGNATALALFLVVLASSVIRGRR